MPGRDQQWAVDVGPAQRPVKRCSGVHGALGRFNLAMRSAAGWSCRGPPAASVLNILNEGLEALSRRAPMLQTRDLRAPKVRCVIAVQVDGELHS